MASRLNCCGVCIPFTFRGCGPSKRRADLSFPAKNHPMSVLQIWLGSYPHFLFLKFCDLMNETITEPERPGVFHERLPLAAKVPVFGNFSDPVLWSPELAQRVL